MNLLMVALTLQRLDCRRRWKRKNVVAKKKGGNGDGDGHVLVEQAGIHAHIVDIADMSAHLPPFIKQAMP